MSTKQLIDPNLDFKIYITHDPKAWLPAGKTYNAIKVGVNKLLLKNYNAKNVSKLEIKGFSRSKSLEDYGFCQYGYNYFFNHPKYGQIKIAYGMQGYNGSVSVVSNYRTFSISSEKKFDIDSYKSESELEREVEEYAIYLKKQVLLFIENFNKENDPDYGKIVLDHKKVLYNLRKKFGDI